MDAAIQFVSLETIRRHTPGRQDERVFLVGELHSRDELKGKKLKGGFVLAQMKGLPKSTGKEWLLMKKKDSHALPYFAIKTELTPARLAKLKEKVPPCETD